METVARTLLSYLSDVVYDPESAVLDIEELPKEFQEFGKGLVYFSKCVMETMELANVLSKGCLDVKLPPSSNELASPVKNLHAALKHLTWQTQQVARGDYQQRLDFMGDFSEAFNSMTEQLEQRRFALLSEIESRERESLNHLQNIANCDTLTQVYNRHYCMELLDQWLYERRTFLLCFVDIDNLKRVNDQFGHMEGDNYIVKVSCILQDFSPDVIACRIGGDEFILLMENWTVEAAQKRMETLRSCLNNANRKSGIPFEYSISYGVIAVEEENTVSANDLLIAADEKMYEYKRAYKRRLIEKQ